MLLLPAAAMTVLAGAAEARTRHPAGNHLSPAEPRLQGVASWYGASHAGRRMSNGEVFDPGQLTAAHASLPLGSRVLVVRADTGAEVAVTITDRIGNSRRVVDLSRAAAEQIGMMRAGLAEVRLIPLAGESVRLGESWGMEPSYEQVTVTHGPRRSQGARKSARVRKRAPLRHVSTLPAPKTAGRQSL
jgi:rare lipoprotein A